MNQANPVAVPTPAPAAVRPVLVPVRRLRRVRPSHADVVAFVDAADALRRIALVYHGALEAICSLPHNADVDDARHLANDVLRAVEERLEEMAGR